MATHSITTTVKREAALQAIVDRINTRRAAATPPKTAITATTYLQKRVNDVLDSYVVQEDYRTEYAGLAAGKRASLGLRAPTDDPNDLGE